MARPHLWFCSTLTSVAVALVLPSLYAQGRQAPTPSIAPVILHIEPNLDLSALEVHYMLAAAASTAFGEIQGRPSVRDFPIVATVDGRPARTLKGFAYLPGFAYGLIAADLGDGAAGRILTVTLQPLAAIRMTGRVRKGAEARAAAVASAATADPGERLKVLVSFVPTWQCEFFGLVECLVEPRPIAAATVAADGAFALDVPDFSHDPALAPYRNRGEFDLTLVRDGSPNPSGKVGTRVPISTSYEPITLAPN